MNDHHDQRHPRRDSLPAALAAILLAIGLVSSSCAPLPPPTGGSNPPGMGGGYVGLTKQAAIAKATASGTPYRIVSENGVGLPVVMDYLPGRVNFSIMAGRVVSVTNG